MIPSCGIICRYLWVSGKKWQNYLESLWTFQVEIKPDVSTEAGAAILGLFYWPQANVVTDVACSPTRYCFGKCKEAVCDWNSEQFLLYIIHSEVLRASPLLVAVTHFGLLAFSAQTMEIFNVVNFRGTCILLYYINVSVTLSLALPLPDLSHPLHGANLHSVPTTAACDFSYNPLTHEVYSNARINCVSQ